MDEIIYANIGQFYTPEEDLAYGELAVKQNQAIKMSNGIITGIGDSDQMLLNNPGIQAIDCEGYTAIPAFVDPHTHPVFWQTRQEEFRMRIEGRDYEEIAAAGGGIRNSVRSLRQAGYEDLLAKTIDRLSVFPAYGTLTIEAKSGYGLSLEDEVKSLRVLRDAEKYLPLKIVPTFLGAHEIPDEYQGKADDYVALLTEEMIPHVAAENLAVFCDVFCEKNVFSVAQSRRILEAAKAHGLRPKLHADELHSFGAAELAAEVGAISADHLVKVSDAGIDAMAAAGVIPVLLPATTFFLRKDDYAPARKMLDKGLKVALSTDFNPGSSMTQNMHIVITIAALKMGMLPNEILDAVTLTAARAIGLEKETGSLEIGKFGDFLLLDIPDIDYLPYHFAVNHILLQVKAGIVIDPDGETHED
jgi:imidazolonepropionase